MFTANEIRTLTLDEIHVSNIQEGLQAEALRNAVAGGTYVAKILDIQAYVDTERERQMAKVSLQVLREDGKDLKKITARVSWDCVVVNGRADKPFRLYAAINAALGLDSSDPRELLTSGKGAYVKVSFTDSYVVTPEQLHEADKTRVPNGKGEIWISLTGTGEEVTAQRGHYLAKQAKPIFLVNNFFSYDN